jgi:DNA-binding MarR family transcriptional regulator
MTAVNGPMPDHLLALAGDVLQRFRDDMAEQMQQPAMRRRAAVARGLRSSQIRLLSMTPAAGMRVTDLAERVGMSKQALGEFANELETRGLMESVRDPADRRVRIVRPTALGRRAVTQAEAVIAAVEQQWRERLGEQRWTELRALLREAATIGRPADDANVTRAAATPGPAR